MRTPLASTVVPRNHPGGVTLSRISVSVTISLFPTVGVFGAVKGATGWVGRSEQRGPWHGGRGERGSLGMAVE
jgi:hypothetical protein